MSSDMESKRPTWHHVFINQLTELSKRSCCLKIQTAALIAVGSQPICFGYNGTFSKHAECSTAWFDYYSNLVDDATTEGFDQWITTDEFKDLHREWSKSNEIHAETNALTWISKRDITDDHVMYTLYSPCDACAKTIMSYGIKTVYYKKMYSRGEDALTRLRHAGVRCEQI